MYTAFKSSNICMHSAGVVGCSSKRVWILHILPLAVDTAFWSGQGSRNIVEKKSCQGNHMALGNFAKHVKLVKAKVVLCGLDSVIQKVKDIVAKCVS